MEAMSRPVVPEVGELIAASLKGSIKSGGTRAPAGPKTALMAEGPTAPALAQAAGIRRTTEAIGRPEG